MASRPHGRGFTILELGISLLLVAVLLAVLVPTLSTARQTAHREQCADHQWQIGAAWQAYLAEHNGEFPFIADQPGWMYAGMRFSSADGLAFPDPMRPLNAYLPLPRTKEYENVVCCCPADRGITDPTEGLGTGSRTAFRSFGTSYRANSALLGGANSMRNASAGALPSIDIARSHAIHGHPPATPDGSSGEFTGGAEGVARSSIVTSPYRMLVMGDPVWYERAEDTGRSANWHGVAGAGNLLFLDGSVRFLSVRPRKVVGPIVFDPQFELAARPSESESDVDDHGGDVPRQ